MNIKNFATICRKNEQDLKQSCYDYLIGQGYEKANVIRRDGYLLAIGTVPVLLMAHLDTVHEKLPDPVLIDEELKILTADNGIGGDDRCGIYIIRELVKELKCSVLICEQEEIGGVGASKFVKDYESKLLPDLSSLSYIIEFDRKGDKDAVFYDCDNPAFTQFIESTKYFKTAYGSFSDISTVAPELGVAAVNLSSGYYCPHTKQEYVDITDVDTIIDEAKRLINSSNFNVQYEYIEVKRKYGYDYGNIGNWWRKGYTWDEWYGSPVSTTSTAVTDDEPRKGDTITVTLNEWFVQYINSDGGESYEMVEATSEEEAIGIFLMNHIDMCYRDVIDAFEEDYN